MDVKTTAKFYSVAEVINNCGAGIPINKGSVSILMYADDIALISETPDGLQKNS